MTSFSSPGPPNHSLRPSPLAFPSRSPEFARSATRPNGIQLVLEDYRPVRINADAAQIQQVLINLVQNAADSMNGVAQSRCGRAKIASALPTAKPMSSSSNRLTLAKASVPKFEKRLFDPFFTTKATGTGLVFRLPRASSKNTAARSSTNPGQPRHHHSELSCQN